MAHGSQSKQSVNDVKASNIAANNPKVFSPEQVEDLEGVLWKSYFA